MTSNRRIIECRPMPNYILWIKFSDGVNGEVDLSDLVGKGVFKLWNNREEFDKVVIDSEAGTVCWAQTIDLDPCRLREDVLKSQPHAPAKKRKAS